MKTIRICLILVCKINRLLFETRDTNNQGIHYSNFQEEKLLQIRVILVLRRDKHFVVKLCAVMWCTVYYAPQMCWSDDVMNTLSNLVNGFRTFVITDYTT